MRPIFGERRRLIVVISLLQRIKPVVLTLMSIPPFVEWLAIFAITNAIEFCSRLQIHICNRTPVLIAFNRHFLHLDSKEPHHGKHVSRSSPSFFR